LNEEGTSVLMANGQKILENVKFFQKIIILTLTVSIMKILIL